MINLNLLLMRHPFLITLLTVAGLVPGQVAGAEDHPRERQILTVSATGTEEIEASVAEVRLAIEEQGLTDEEARQRMARRSNRLLEYLREENVERLETTSLRLHPIYDYTKGDRDVVGYQAMSMIRFRSDVERIGSIIDEAIARGANQVQDLVFTAPDVEIEAARQQALRAATHLALQRADAVLEELGLQRQRIVRVQVSAADPEPPHFPMPRAEARRVAAADRAPTDVEAGEPSISASVTLEIAY